MGIGVADTFSERRCPRTILRCVILVTTAAGLGFASSPLLGRMHAPPVPSKSLWGKDEPKG